MTIKLFRSFEFSQKIFSPVQFEIDCIVSISYQYISKGFRVTDLNSRVDARVIASVDGGSDGGTYRLTDACTNGPKTGSLYIASCRRQAGQYKSLICRAA